MGRPKIVVVGAGSLFFGRPVICKMMQSPVLREGTLALVDVDAGTLDTMMGLAQRVREATGAPTVLAGATDRREVIADADFVVLTFALRNAYYRGVDCEVSAKHGITMCSGDTIGPGGVFRALREIPTALGVARDVAELAPRAWVVNLVNPTTVLGMALARYAPDVRSFALCDGLHEPHYRMRVLRAVGLLSEEAETIPPEVEAKLDLAVGGVNHFTWMLRFRYDGKDMMPRWREVIARRAQGEGTGETDSKARYNATYALELMDIFGAYPDRIEHTKEYVPFYQDHGTHPVRPAPLTLFDAVAREQRMAAHMAENAAYAKGKRGISELLSQGLSDHASDVIESMWGRLGRPFYINTANGGAIPNLPPDAFLELRCDVDMDGPRPQRIGEMPKGVLGLSQRVLDVHELTAEAGATFDRGLVLRALATDPLICNLGDARQIMAELFEREREVLDSRWYSPTG